jgi:hypothetical protein
MSCKKYSKILLPDIYLLFFSFYFKNESFTSQTLSHTHTLTHTHPHTHTQTLKHLQTHTRTHTQSRNSYFWGFSWSLLFFRRVMQTLPHYLFSLFSDFFTHNKLAIIFILMISDFELMAEEVGTGFKSWLKLSTVTFYQ